MVDTAVWEQIETTDGDPRMARGLEIAATRNLTRQSAHAWLVPSTTAVHPKKYRVDTREETCTCPDYEERTARCKHLYAVEFTERRREDGKGNVEVTRTVRVTYGQKWTEYNAAQVEEKRRLRPLLADLCRTIEQPEQSNGRPRLALNDMVFATVMKVYEGLSARRFMSDLTEAQEAGYVARVPHFNSVCNYMADPALTPILKSLIAASAVPLRSVETDFAIDASGFSTGQFARWFNKRWGREVETHEWRKLHIVVGTNTKIVAAAEVTDGFAADSPQFMGLLTQPAQTMNVVEITADKAYATRKNMEGAGKLGVVPYIPFKRGTVAPQPALDPADDSVWTKMYYHFALRREEFLTSYHRRSNVESAFSMIKRKFGDAIRSKGETAQVNEVLAKVLAHNLCVLINAAHTLGIDPCFGATEAFCAETPAAQEVLLF